MCIFLFTFFYILVYHGILNIVSCARTLLFIRPLYNSLPLLIPNSHSFPPPAPSSLATTSLFSMSVSRVRFIDVFIYVFCLFICFVYFLGLHPWYNGSSQSRGGIRTAAASLHHSHSNAGSEPQLQPTPQLMAMPDPPLPLGGARH